MKKIILLVLFGPLLSTALRAQTNHFSMDIEKDEPSTKRKLITSPAQLKAEITFKRNNPNVSSVRWYDDPDGYFVYFLEDGKRARNFYDRKGNFVYSALSYSEDRLTPRMKDWILSSFDGKIKITHVNELRQNAKLVYLVTVTDDKLWKKVRIEGDDLEVIDTFRAG